MGSLSLLENDVGLPSCNLKKIVPAERLMSFMILHRYRSMDPMFTHLSHPVYFTNRNVNAGLLQLEEPIAQVSYPTSKPCWDSIYSKNQKLLSTEDLEALNKTVFFAYEGPIYQLINGRKVSIGTESQLQKLGYTKKDVVLGKHPAFEYIPKEP